MLRKLLLVVVLGVVAVLVYDHGRTIQESHVRAHYRDQLEALRAFDEKAVCAGIAADYRLTVVDRTAAHPGSDTLDGPQSCELSRKFMQLARHLSGQTGGLVNLDVSYDIRSIHIAADGRSATVEATSTVKLGETLVSRTRGSEKLSRSFWRIRSHGGDAQVWSYGG